MNDCFLRNNAIPRRLNLNNFKFHLSLVTLYGESIALPDWAVGVPEVRSEVDIKDRAIEAFDVIYRRPVLQWKYECNGLITVKVYTYSVCIIESIRL